MRKERLGLGPKTEIQAKRGRPNPKHYGAQYIPIVTAMTLVVIARKRSCIVAARPLFYHSFYDDDGDDLPLL